MRRRVTTGAVLAAAAAMLWTAAAAHPHMFVDAQSTLLVDASGRLTGVRTALIVDPLTTQFVLEEHGVPADAPLTDDDRRAIAQGMVDGLGAHDFFTEFKRGGAPVAIAQASVGQIQLHDDLLAAALELTVAEPFPLAGAPLELALFDPTYFAAVTTLGPPVLPVGAGACAVAFTRFEPRSLDSVALLELGRLSREETPDDPRIGARFADRSRITCDG